MRPLLLRAIFKLEVSQLASELRVAQDVGIEGQVSVVRVVVLCGYRGQHSHPQRVGRDVHLAAILYGTQLEFPRGRAIPRNLQGV